MTHTLPAVARHRFRSMGTDVSVLLPSTQQDAVGPVQELFKAWDDRFSRFKPDSELMQLNGAAGVPYPVSEPMFNAVGAALAAARATDGLFDPLLLTRISDLGYDVTYDLLPPDRAFARLRPWRAGEWRSVRLDADRRTVQLPRGNGLDLGGLAKGMAVDAALEMLVRAGVPFAAVNAGGDLAVHGLPPGSDAWSVEIEGGGGRAVSLRRGALATSSILRRRWFVDGVACHHLLDPRSGAPAQTGLAQVSVAAQSCRQAEVAAKAALLMGSVRATDFVERKGLAALVVTCRGEELRLGTWQ